MIFSFLKAIFFTCLLSCGLARPISYEDDFGGRRDVLSYLRKLVKKDRGANYVPPDGELFEGDIVMSPQLRNAIERGGSKRSAMSDEKYKWPDAVVPYEFHTSLLPKVRRQIIRGIGLYQKYTCVKFVPRKNEEDYVIFRSKPHVCSSHVGRRGGGQHVTLGSGCMRIGTVLHEMMHALGVIHEQSRPDRDEHIIVKMENIEEKYLHNFQKYSFEDITNVNVPYNYASLMHYRNNAFSKNGAATLVARNDPSLQFGQRVMFSIGDIEQINRLYKCLKSKRHDQPPAKVRLFQDAVKNNNLIPNVFDTAEEYY